jgi:predicted ester cyclase
MSPNEMKQFVVDFFNEVWSGNLALLEEHPGMHETIPFLSALLDAVEVLDNEVAQQLVDGPWVVTRAVNTIYYKKEFMGVPAGQQQRVETIMMHKIENGVIVKQHGQGGPV